MGSGSPAWPSWRLDNCCVLGCADCGKLVRRILESNHTHVDRSAEKAVELAVRRECKDFVEVEVIIHEREDGSPTFRLFEVNRCAKWDLIEDRPVEKHLQKS